MKKNVAWIVPPLLNGGGGARTIIENANYLTTHGWKSDIYIDINPSNKKNIDLKNDIIKAFGKCECNVFYLSELKDKYEVMIATYSINTPEIVYHSQANHKIYFIQDFEPWFEPMGDLYLKRENTYRLGLKGISIGRWLNYKLENEYGMKMSHFPFCANLDIYKPISIKKENAICFIYQPEKTRRCDKLGIQALRIVKKLKPNVKIYLYGSKNNIDFDFPIENLGLLSVDECNVLYNKCTVGLCISASNPSRIPFEMMASGLPVIDIYRENNLYDYTDNTVLLSVPTPDAIASALISVLDNPNMQVEMSKNGLKFIKNYPIKKGFEIFLNYMNSLDDDLYCNQITSSYHKKPFESTPRTKECLNNIYNSNKIKIKHSLLNKISVEVYNPFSINEIKELLLAKWSKPDQSDLKWIPFSKHKNKYIITFNSNGLNKKDILHVYVKDINNQMYNIIQTHL